jgi:hypothetical protein
MGLQIERSMETNDLQCNRRSLSGFNEKDSNVRDSDKPGLMSKLQGTKPHRL